MWRVVLHDDEVTSFAVVVHVVQTLCGMTVDDAMNVAATVHHHRKADVAEYADQAAAEHLVVAFQRRGIDASLRPV